jgi:hypothetical protein
LARIIFSRAGEKKTPAFPGGGENKRRIGLN